MDKIEKVKYYIIDAFAEDIVDINFTTDDEFYTEKPYQEISSYVKSNISMLTNITLNIAFSELEEVKKIEKLKNGDNKDTYKLNYNNLDPMDLGIFVLKKMEKVYEYKSRKNDF